MSNIVNIYFTMVSRKPNPQAPKDTAAAAYGVIGSDYKMYYLSGAEVIARIGRGEYFTNMGVEKGKLVVTNGNADRYTVYNEFNQPVNGYKAVILGRTEVKNELAGYILFDAAGQLRKVRIAEAVELAKKGLIANGKIRETNNGPIVSSISGNYPIQELNVPKTKEINFADCRVDLLYVTMIAKKSEGKHFYVGAVVTCDNMTSYGAVIKKLAESSETCVNKALEFGNKDAVKEMQWGRVSDNAFYGAFEYSLLEALAKGGATIDFDKNIQKMSVIYQAYGVDTESGRDESSVWVKKTEAGTLAIDSGNQGELKDTSEKALEFAKKVRSQFSGLMSK